MEKAATFTAAIAAAVLAGGCKPAPPRHCENIRALQATRIVEHPGAGREVTVRLDFTDGVPTGPSDLAHCLTTTGGPEAPAAQIAGRPVERGYTLLLVDPGAGPRDSEAVRGMVEALARSGSAADALAVYRWGAEVTQVVPFLSDRRLLLERLASATSPAASLAPVDAALTIAAQALKEVGGAAADALRTIVLVAPRSSALPGLGAAIEKARPNLLAWVGFSDHPELAAALPPGLRFVAGAAPEPAATALGQRLDAYRRHAHYGLGLCGEVAQLSLAVAAGPGRMTTVDLAALLPENQAGSCQPQELAAGRRRFPSRLELVFSPEQRAAADVAFLDRAGQPNFDVSARVAEGAALTPATAHFRGGGSYGCQRRNYSVNLQGRFPRFFFPGFASSKFHLVAMCLDRLYLRNFTALQMMAAEGLMPVPFDMVELAVDGVSQGPYLVVENVSDSLRTHHSGVTAVVRRNSVPGGQGTAPEVRWSAADEATALASYASILGAAEGLSGPTLEKALASRFDLESYLTWVALMNLIGSGDYVDEMYFYSVETTSPEGQRADYHRVMGWDQDDLFGSCHYSGRWAIHDGNRLLECAEAELDRRLFLDPHLYRRYADVLASVIERHPPERFVSFLANTTRRLEGFFANREALAALVELRRLNSEAPADPALARTLLESESELLAVQYEQTRTELLRRLALYRR